MLIIAVVRQTMSAVEVHTMSCQQERTGQVAAVAMVSGYVTPSNKAGTSKCWQGGSVIQPGHR